MSRKVPKGKKPYLRKPHGQSQVLFDAEAARWFCEEVEAILPAVETSMEEVLDAGRAKGSHALSPENLAFLSLVDIVHLHVLVASTMSCPECCSKYGIEPFREDSPANKAFSSAMTLLTWFIFNALVVLKSDGKQPIWVPERLRGELEKLPAGTKSADLMQLVARQQFFRELRDNYLNCLFMELATRLALRRVDAPGFDVDAFGLPCVHQCFDQGPFGEADDMPTESVQEQFLIAQDVFRVFLGDINAGGEDLQHLMGTARILH